MNIGTLITTWIFGELVGTDGSGNRYYRMRAGKRAGRERRWVLYSGAPEASKVPPGWHAWLHHSQAEPPEERDLKPYPWVAPHAANPTGTDAAYRPPGHVLTARKRAHGTGDYEPWRPS